MEKQNEWIEIGEDESKPMPDKKTKFFSVEVDVKTPHGQGTGRYNYMDDDWLVSLNADPSDELQAYKGVTHWRDI